MTQLGLPPEGINLFQSLIFVRQNKIDSYLFLRQVAKQNGLPVEEIELMNRFIDSLQGRNNMIKSQLYQDAFAAFIVGDDYPHTFLEFGATDGVSLSNSYMLEQNLGWTGALCEPSPQWHAALFANRKDARVLIDCIWRSSDEWLDFLVSDEGVFSTIDAFKNSDIGSMPGNTAKRNEASRNVKVRSISLNDVVEHYLEGKVPSYMSVDTEGSEFEILNAFYFNRYRPVVLTIEHNFTEMQARIDRLMEDNGYTRVFRNVTLFDAWYVENQALARFSA